MTVYTSQIKNQLVAVYGSLRHGMGNFPVNKNADAVYIGDGQTVKNFDLFEYYSGAFPSVSLTHSESEKPVQVEVFQCSMQGLTGPYDTLEGYPHFYNRSKVAIQLENGDVCEAWIYHIDEVTGERVEHGDWVKHKLGE